VALAIRLQRAGKSARGDRQQRVAFHAAPADDAGLAVKEGIGRIDARPLVSVETRARQVKACRLLTSGTGHQRRAIGKPDGDKVAAAELSEVMELSEIVGFDRNQHHAVKTAVRLVQATGEPDDLLAGEAAAALGRRRDMQRRVGRRFRAKEKVEIAHVGAARQPAGAGYRNASGIDHHRIEIALVDTAQELFLEVERRAAALPLVLDRHRQLVDLRHRPQQLLLIGFRTEAGVQQRFIDQLLLVVIDFQQGGQPHQRHCQQAADCPSQSDPDIGPQQSLPERFHHSLHFESLGSLPERTARRQSIVPAMRAQDALPTIDARMFRLCKTTDNYQNSLQETFL